MKKIGLLTAIILGLIVFKSQAQSYIITSYYYDPANQLTEIIYPDGSATFIEYDDLGNQVETAYSLAGDSPFGTALPVEYLKFEVKKYVSDAIVIWQTISEINNYGFIVQRSFDGYQFDSIGFVKGNGNSNTLQNYRYVDYQPTKGKSGIIYYRLKQIDYDGKFELSESRAVVFEGIETEIVVYPNPATDIIHVLTKDSLEYNYVIMSLAGSIYSRGKIENNDQINIRDLPAGIFLLRLYDERRSLTYKVVKI